jgi:hypothetical protein
MAIWQLAIIGVGVISLLGLLWARANERKRAVR